MGAVRGCTVAAGGGLRLPMLGRMTIETTTGDAAASPVPDRSGVSVCVVGSGTAFLSGLSYYTHQLASAFAERYPTQVILMRRLIPARFYPGRKRIAAPLSNIAYPSS